MLAEKFGKCGYKPCPLCGTPIRPLIWLGPTGRILKQSTGPSIGRPVELRKMCEVCFIENRGQVGGESHGVKVHLDERQLAGAGESEVDSETRKGVDRGSD